MLCRIDNNTFDVDTSNMERVGSGEKRKTSSSPPPKRQRYIDSYVTRTDSSSADTLGIADAQTLEKKTSREFRDYMSSKYPFLCLKHLPRAWFNIIFDQKMGDDGGVERMMSDSAAHAIHEVLKSETRLICPQPLENIWKWAMTLPDPNDVRVVIIGQDPYHTVARVKDSSELPITMADGLAFSVNPVYARLGKGLPPSLVNIMKLADKSFDTRRYDDTTFNGDLSMWTENGVLLLNSALTTVEETPNAHAHIGWDAVTDRIVEWFGRKADNESHTRIFMLWGKEACKIKNKIDQSTHVVITTCHPSPLSAFKNGWFKKDIFKEANLVLRALGRSPIKWSCRRPLKCHEQSRLNRSLKIQDSVSASEKKDTGHTKYV